MLQCENCEFFSKEPNGRITLRCNPFGTIKEPACLDKWQLLRLDGILQGYQATLRWYQKLAPMQEKMFEFMKREMDDVDDAESWKYNDEEEDEDAEGSGESKDDQGW